MLDIIQIGTTGMLSNAKGLRVVGNNLANVNTGGFKGSQLQFGDLLDQGGSPQLAQNGSHALGQGVQTLGSSINFKAGADQQTGNPLDLSIQGEGLFAIQRGDTLLYTRAGDFHFDNAGMLVNAGGDHVLALDGGGKLINASLAGLERSAPKPTGSVKLTGNLSSTVLTPAVDTNLNGISVVDAGGTPRSLNVKIHNNGGGAFTVSVADAATNAAVATSTLTFAAGFPTQASSLMAFSYTPDGAAASTITLDFSANVTSLAASSTLSVQSQDGYAAGVMASATVDAKGVLKIAYSNGQSADGATLALARVDNKSDLEQVGGSAFALKAGGLVKYGRAGVDTLGTLAAGHREGSNVDLADEFSNLILMQRGYQASSHTISVANDMIQELFDMKGHR